jgi:hypothetical protein
MKPAGPQRGSPIRQVSGIASLLTSLVLIAAGFVQLVTALERGGYGTTANSIAFIWLGAGGGFLGLGIVLLIWEYSVRHNVRH